MALSILVLLMTTLPEVYALCPRLVAWISHARICCFSIPRYMTCLGCTVDWYPVKLSRVVLGCFTHTGIIVVLFAALQHNYASSRDLMVVCDLHGSSVVAQTLVCDTPGLTRL